VEIESRVSDVLQLLYGKSHDSLLFV
jgi:hypothetical protein